MPSRSRSSFFFAFFVGIVLLFSRPAHAQLGVYVDFSAVRVNSPSTSSNWIYGPSFGAYLDHGHFGFFSAGVDARAVIADSSSTTQFKAGYVGPRLVFRPHVLPIMPYVEGLVGAGNLQYMHNAPGFALGDAVPVTTSTTKFSYQFVGGIDYTILPRLDWRVVDFSYGGLSILGSSYNPKTISTGIVLRLPGVF